MPFAFGFWRVVGNSGAARGAVRIVCKYSARPFLRRGLMFATREGDEHTMFDACY